MSAAERFDAIVIGGGFYGAMLALHLRRRGLARVALFEREPELMTRASYANQARIHNGYHYPRSYLTAHRSRINLPRFCAEFATAVRKDFTCLYAVAAKRSKVTPTQFERFAKEIDAPLERAEPRLRALFDPRLIAAVYLVEEYAFDAAVLRRTLEAALSAAGVDVRCGHEAGTIAPHGELLEVEHRSAAGTGRTAAGLVLNCGYARLNHNVARPDGLSSLKHELTEIALVDPPPELRGIGVTIIDGPFFSCMPFPAEGCHSLTHVSYTPRRALLDADGALDVIGELREHSDRSRFAQMAADGARYLPCLRRAGYRRSLFEVKTVLVRNEVDDGRPILFRREPAHPRLFSILGAKIDNVYDVLDELDCVLAT